MKKISRTVLLNYSAEQMFDIVADVGAYPNFLPWCGGTQVLEHTEKLMKATILIQKMGLKKSFTTNNALVQGERIEMKLVDGPFKSLNGEWYFKALDKAACKVSFEIEFEVENGLMSQLLGNIFEQIANTLVDSFVERAKAIYGEGKLGG
ncbi:type II toxin-antitoxin system RatA family toxin [Thiomicrospira microaerophila]|uniref:type II toxin-antitoxin system RatA family toxin n=1 Tax=Thiomicrospira microaerophila TaxID=406020 RepID=UPI00200EB080|nr:type II toxin-antitoxin system RatA family toxin [Thiomicrospira microaerophila]UQB41619.1 type II toxin-antitoxin system RatA family toxin [Thiomicrospira microaerophila]